jgi:TolB-like protein
VSVHVELEKILGSEVFVHSRRLSRFLRFVVEWDLTQRAEQLKEYIIGVEVFDRGFDFDPRLDSVVRTEARRLRSKLREYYQTSGKDDLVRIEIPKGSYVPVFHDCEDRNSRSACPNCLPRSNTVAVLPFLNLSGDPQCEFFSDGLTGELIHTLACLSQFFVASQTSAFAFKGKPICVREIGRKLKVRTVVEGSVRTSNDRWRIIAQLVDSVNDYPFWSGRYDCQTADTLEIQEEIAQSVTRALCRRLAV